MVGSARAEAGVWEFGEEAPVLVGERLRLPVAVVAAELVAREGGKWLSPGSSHSVKGKLKVCADGLDRDMSKRESRLILRPFG